MEPHKARSARTRSRHSLESPARSARPSRVRGRQAHTRDVVLSFADEPVLTQRYLDIIDEAASASDTTGNVYRFNLTELRATNALLALAVDVRTGRVVAGAHAVRTAGGALIQGVVTARAWRRRGIAKRIVATLIRWLAESDHIERFSLAVRLYDGDRPNAAAYPLFTSFGFVASEPVTYTVTGSPKDAHLDDGTGHFRALPLQAGSEALAIARRVLRDGSGGGR